MLKTERSHYVDNKAFYEALKAYYAACEAAEERDELVPVVPDYVARCLLKIVEGMSRRLQFSGYIFLDEMKADAIENCIRYIRSFDPERGSNPFAYFSRVIYFAFVRRINAEKKGLYVKYKMTEMANMQNAAATHHASGMGPDQTVTVTHSDHTQEKIDKFVEQFEKTNNLTGKKR